MYLSQTMTWISNVIDHVFLCVLMLIELLWGWLCSFCCVLMLIELLWGVIVFVLLCVNVNWVIVRVIVFVLLELLTYHCLNSLFIFVLNVSLTVPWEIRFQQEILNVTKLLITCLFWRGFLFYLIFCYIFNSSFNKRCYFVYPDYDFFV